jgi:propanol-preferring alcohol dehydrogenase
MDAMILFEHAPITTSPLRLTRVNTPVPAAGEVRVKVSCCAICRTDLHVIEGDLPGRKLPVVPGHQVVGTVEALGPGCRRLKVGDRVGIAWLRETCGACPFCVSGRENLCEEPRFTGYHHDGGYAEFAVVAEDFAYDIPAGFRDVDAAPLLCAGIIGYRALERSRLPDGGNLGLVGFGSSAHVVLQVARHRGARVYVVTRGERHRELARHIGADWVGATTAGLPVPLDSAILFAPSGDLVPPVLAALRHGGTLALAGITMSDIPSLQYESHLFHEKDLRTVTANTRFDGRSLLAEAASIPIRPHTTAYDLVDANLALQDLKADRIQGTGVLLVG